MLTSEPVRAPMSKPGRIFHSTCPCVVHELKLSYAHPRRLVSTTDPGAAFPPLPTKVLHPHNPTGVAPGT